jgi:small subunit ribosomal protein S6
VKEVRTYEALFIVRPDVADEDIQTMAKTVEKIITDNGGSIVRSEIWGKRRLAYEVQKFTEGIYILIRFDAPAAVIGRLENHFRLAEEVIRYLTVHFDEQTLRLEAEQKQRREEEIAKSAAAAAGDDDDEDDAVHARGRGRRRRDDDDDDDED